MDEIQKSIDFTEQCANESSSAGSVSVPAAMGTQPVGAQQTPAPAGSSIETADPPDRFPTPFRGEDLPAEQVQPQDQTAAPAEPAAVLVEGGTALTESTTMSVETVESLAGTE